MSSENPEILSIIFCKSTLLPGASSSFCKSDEGLASVRFGESLLTRARENLFLSFVSAQRAKLVVANLLVLFVPVVSANPFVPTRAL